VGRSSIKQIRILSKRDIYFHFDNFSNNDRDIIPVLYVLDWNCNVHNEIFGKYKRIDYIWFL